MVVVSTACFVLRLVVFESVEKNLPPKYQFYQFSRKYYPPKIPSKFTAKKYTGLEKELSLCSKDTIIPKLSFGHTKILRRKLILFYHLIMWQTWSFCFLTTRKRILNIITETFQSQLSKSHFFAIQTNISKFAHCVSVLCVCLSQLWNIITPCGLSEKAPIFHCVVLAY